MSDNYETCRRVVSAWRHVRAVLAATVLLSIADVHASDTDLIRGGVLADRTSDGYDRNEAFLEYRNHRREFHWPWIETETRTLDWGVAAKYLSGRVGPAKYDGERAMAMLGKRFTDAMYVEGWLGGHRLRPDGPQDKTIGLYAAYARLTPAEGLTVHFDAERDFVYAENVLPAGVTDRLVARGHGAGGEWRPARRVRVLEKSRWRDYSDDNHKRQHILNVFYGISPDTPWIWAGVGAERIDFSRQVTGYWSPVQFTAYGVRLESSFPITDRLNGSAAFNRDRLDEDGLSGRGGYYALGLEVPLTRALFLKLDVSRVSSIQAGSRWTENTYVLSVAGGLP